MAVVRSTVRPKQKRAPARRRLAPLERERMIVAEAMRFFADVGLGGSTSALAKRLGITQPLLFNYFRTKEELIGRIYHDLIPHIWKPGWLALIRDRRVPLQERLVRFYVDYAQTVFARDQFRLFLFAGMVDFDRFGTRYNSLLRREIFPAIADALAAEYGAGKHLGDRGLELAHGLHGMIYHLALRKWVFQPPLEGSIADYVPEKVALFLGGVAAALRGQAVAT